MARSTAPDGRKVAAIRAHAARVLRPEAMTMGPMTDRIASWTGLPSHPSGTSVRASCGRDPLWMPAPCPDLPWVRVSPGPHCRNPTGAVMQALRVPVGAMGMDGYGNRSRRVQAGAVRVPITGSVRERPADLSRAWEIGRCRINVLGKSICKQAAIVRERWRHHATISHKIACKRGRKNSRDRQTQAMVTTFCLTT
ncbi:MAG: hypothetical protein OXC91_07000 [Rhodobacteraceae bacterium]|nr:hypothetical protein [Paracoccaceae bacterium]